MPKVIPVLNDTSWTDGPLAKGRALLANYMLTDRWQSHSYNSTVYSIVDIMQEYPDDPEEMQRKVQQNLTDMYKLHFDSVDVYVELEPEPSKTLNISLTWTQDGSKYSITNHLVSIKDTLSKVADLHNYGA